MAMKRIIFTEEKKRRMECLCQLSGRCLKYFNTTSHRRICSKCTEYITNHGSQAGLKSRPDALGKA